MKKMHKKHKFLKTAVVSVTLLALLAGLIPSAAFAETVQPVETVAASQVEEEPATGSQQAEGEETATPEAEKTEETKETPAVTAEPGIAVVLSAFEALGEEIAIQQVAAGNIADKNGLTLPTSLVATGPQGRVTVEGITWDCPNFAPDTEGEYTFTAVLPKGYSLAQEASLPTILVKVVAGSVLRTPRAVNFEAIFGGVDITKEDAKYATNFLTAFNLGAVLNVKEKFAQENSAKTIKIEVGEGFGLLSAPGMVATNDNKDNWNFKETELPSIYRGFITGGKWEQAPKVDGRQVRAGVLTYTLAPGTIDFMVGVSIIADNFYVASSHGLGPEAKNPAGSYEFKNEASPPVQVTTYQQEQKLNSAVLKSFTIDTWQGYFYATTNGDQSMAKAAPGEAYNNMDVLFSYIVEPYTAVKALHGEVKLTYQVPKAAGLTGGNITAGQTLLTETPNAVHFSEVDRTTSPDYDFITVTFDKEANLARMAIFWFNGKVAADAVPGTILAAELVSATVTRWDGNTFTWKKGTAQAEEWMKVRTNPRVKVLKPAGGGLDLPIIKQNVYAQEETSPAALRPLGVFCVENNTAAPISGRRAKLDFSDPNIGVKAVILATGPSGATNVVVTTSKGNTITKESVPKTHSGNNSDFACFSLANELAEDEYITQLEYNMGDMAVGITGQKDFAYAFNGGTDMYYYGKLLGTANHSATLTILKDDGNGGWAAENSVTQTTTVSSLPVMAANVNGAGNREQTTLAGGGAAQTISLVVSPGAHNYKTIYSFTGFVFYVRELPGLHVDPATIKVEWNGTTYTKYEKIKDDKGNIVYKVTVSDQILGSGTKALMIDVPGANPKKKDFERYPSPTLSVSVSAEETAPSQTIAISDILFGHIYGGEQYTYLTYDTASIGKFTQAGSSASDAVNVVGWKAGKVSIAANPVFAVGTRADKADDNWLTYQGTAETYIGLNALLKARYRVDLINNTGKEVDGGFTALIPIPKKGENAPAPDDGFMPVGSTFGWTLNMEGPLNLGAGYTVQYATSYLATTDATGWVEAGSITDWKQVRMVKVTYTALVPVGFTTNVVIPLAVGHAGAEAAELQGALDIYSSRVYVNSNTGITGWKSSLPVALQLNTGIVQGTVQMDSNRDGSAAGEAGYANITVEAYKPGTYGTEKPVDTATTGTDGKYLLAGLSGEKVDLVFSNPGTTNDPMRYVQPTLQTAQNTELVIKNVTPGTSTPKVQDALLQQPWTVSFALPAKSTLVNSQFVWPGAKATKPSPDPSRIGHTFAGWFADAAYATAWNFDTAISANTTIHGKMTANDVAINLYPNDGKKPTTAADIFTVKYEGTIPTAKQGAPAGGRTGYTFAGWYNTKDAADSRDNTQKRNMAAMITEVGPIDLYAGWTANTYTVTYKNNFKPDNGGDNFTPANSAASSWAYDSAKTAPSNEPTLKGYTFTGWYLFAAYDKQTDVTRYNFDGSYQAAANLTLYAGWKAVDYPITYDLAGGTGAAGNPATYNADKLPLNFSTQPTRTGYTFTGWTGSNGTTPQTTVTILAGTTGNLAYTANWTANQYKLVFNANGGTGTMADQPVTFASPTTLNALAFTNTGHTFIGWSTSPTGTGTRYADKSAYTHAVAEDVTLYAIWSQNNYNVYFNGNEATSGSMDAIEVGFGDSVSLPANQYTRTGYTFMGWGTAASDTTATYTDAASYTQTAAGEVVLYAVWQANPYELVFDANSGTGTMANQSVTYDATAPITANAFTKEGYSFVGWNTNPAATTAQYTDEANYTHTVAEDVTLYAIWSAKTVAVSYDVNGGDTFTPAAGAESGSYDGSIGTEPGIPTREGYLFSKWAGAEVADWAFGASGTTLTVANGVTGADSATPALTLTAQWVQPTATKTELWVNTNNADAGKKLDLTYAEFAALTAEDFVQYAGINAEGVAGSVSATATFTPTAFAPEKEQGAATGTAVPITVSANGASVTVNVTVYLIDDSAPTITTAKESIAVKWDEGGSITVESLFAQFGAEYQDDYSATSVMNGKASAAIEKWDGGKTPGHYTLAISTEDEAGNTSSKNVEVVLFKESVSVKPLRISNKDVVDYNSDVQLYLSKIVASAVYDDGEQVDIPLTELNIPDIANISATPGSYTITVATKNATTATCEVEVFHAGNIVTFHSGVAGLENQFLDGVKPGEKLDISKISMHREGYTLAGWNKADGTRWNFEKDTMPDASLDLYAVWEENPTKPPVSSSETNGGGGSGGGGGGGTTTSSSSRTTRPTSPAKTSSSSSVSSAPSSQPASSSSTVSSAASSAPADVTLNDNATPLGGSPFSQRGVWSVTNLVLSILSLLLAALQLVNMLKRRGITTSTLTKVISVISVVLGVLTPVLFGFGSTFAGGASAVDYMTIPLALLVGGEVVTMLVSKLQSRVN